MDRYVNKENMSFKEKFLKEAKESGVNIRDFCRLAGLSRARFYIVLTTNEELARGYIKKGMSKYSEKVINFTEKHL